MDQNTEEIDLIINNINDYDDRISLPEFLENSPEKAEWFRLPKEIRKLYKSPVSEEDLSLLTNQSISIRDVFRLFGYNLDINKTVPRNREYMINNVNYVYECIGYKTNIIAGASLDNLFSVLLF